MTKRVVKTKIKGGKEHVPEDPESNLSSPDSSSREYDPSDDRKYSKYKSKGCSKNKIRQKHTKQNMSESLSGDSDLSNKSDNKSNKINKKKIYQ